MDGALIDAAAAAGAKGIVIAGVGNGNLTQPAVNALAAQAKKGIVCVRASRVVTGASAATSSSTTTSSDSSRRSTRTRRKRACCCVWRCSSRAASRTSSGSSTSTDRLTRRDESMLTDCRVPARVPGALPVPEHPARHIIGRVSLQGRRLRLGRRHADRRHRHRHLRASRSCRELLRWAFFYLFLFSIGYSVGPQFFGSLKKEALPQIVLALVVARDRAGDGDRRDARRSASTRASRSACCRAA